MRGNKRAERGLWKCSPPLEAEKGNTTNGRTTVCHVPLLMATATPRLQIFLLPTVARSISTKDYKSHHLDLFSQWYGPYATGMNFDMGLLSRRGVTQVLRGGN